MVILAQWSTNTAANLVPPALCFANAGAKWNLSYKVAVLIAGVIAVSYTHLRQVTDKAGQIKAFRGNSEEQKR